MRRLFAIALLVGFVIAPAFAQQRCMLRDDLAGVLSHRYQEHPIGQGLTGDGRLLEVFASEAGSWTLVLTQPSKLSCVYAIGEDWSVPPSSKTEAHLDGPVY